METAPSKCLADELWSCALFNREPIKLGMFQRASLFRRWGARKFCFDG